MRLTGMNAALASRLLRVAGTSVRAGAFRKPKAPPRPGRADRKLI